jgi:hypothetical protein
MSMAWRGGLACWMEVIILLKWIAEKVHFD